MLRMVHTTLKPQPPAHPRGLCVRVGSVRQNVVPIWKVARGHVRNRTRNNPCTSENAVANEPVFPGRGYVPGDEVGVGDESN